jgi:hypothetical protein
MAGVSLVEFKVLQPARRPLHNKLCHTVLSPLATM